jgi:lipoprotein-releasing system ATP-binding protein
MTIRVANITKQFRNDQQNSTLSVLRGVNMEIRCGEIIAIVGPSGAGKSTLLHILGTLDRPTSGTVFYDDDDVFKYPDEQLAQFRNKHVGFVFQFHHLLPEFTALENVALPAMISGKELDDVRERALGLLRDVGVEEKAAIRPPKLSGGEQQRVAVARALMNEPKVVFADEPSGNLDTKNAEQLHELMWTLSRGRGQTFVIVTHNESLAQEADRIIVLKDGRIA